MHFRQFTCFHNKFPMIPCHVFHHPQSLLWWLSICSGLMTLHRKALYLFHTHRHHVSPGNWNTTQADSRIHQDLNLFVTLTNLTWEKKTSIFLTGHLFQNLQYLTISEFSIGSVGHISLNYTSSFTTDL